MQDWHTAMKRWNNLYYCKRDDVVFILGQNSSIPADSMMDLLYA